MLMHLFDGVEFVNLWQIRKMWCFYAILYFSNCIYIDRFVTQKWVWIQNNYFFTREITDLAFQLCRNHKITTISKNYTLSWLYSIFEPFYFTTSDLKNECTLKKIIICISNYENRYIRQGTIFKLRQLQKIDDSFFILDFIDIFYKHIHN